MSYVNYFHPISDDTNISTAPFGPLQPLSEKTMLPRASLAQGKRRCLQCGSKMLFAPRVCIWRENSSPPVHNDIPRWLFQAIERPSVDMPERRCFTSMSSVDLPELNCENSDVAPHIRSCRSGIFGTEYDTGFHIWFLGTGGSIPSKQRLTSCTILQLGGQAFVFDVGEGIQKQLMYTRQRISDVSKIFISHMHADHVLGLPGVLLQLQAAGRSRGYGQQLLEVYGPPGLYNYITATLALTRAGFSHIKVVVYELVGGDADAENQKRHSRRNIVYDHYSELSNKTVLRKSIERNSDGTWTLQFPGELVTENGFDVDRSSNRPLNVVAAEVTHLDEVQTFGYMIQEPEPSPRIDAAKAVSLGVFPGPKYRLLKSGVPVTRDDGSMEVRPEQVLVGANRKSRKCVLIGDNCGLSDAMMELCTDTDVLVHEGAALVEDEEEIRKRGHSSAHMAGELAKSVNAGVLAMNHISAGIGSAELQELVRQAEAANGGVTRVILSSDFMELLVPRFGFDFEKHEHSGLTESSGS